MPEVVVLPLTNEQEFPIEVDLSQIKTPSGRPASIEGDIQWIVSDPLVAAVVPDPDKPGSQFAIVRPLGPPGWATVRGMGDADLGAGVVPIYTPVVEFEVSVAQATALPDITVGPVRPQPVL